MGFGHLALHQAKRCMYWSNSPSYDVIDVAHIWGGCRVSSLFQIAKRISCFSTMRTTIITLLVVAGLCATVSAYSFYVREGHACHEVQLGQCFPCTPQGSTHTYFERCTTFEEGRVGCGIYETNNQTTGCNYQNYYDHWEFSPCATLPQCRVSPASFIIFSAEHDGGISTLCLPDSTGVAAMNHTHATVAGTLETFIFRNEASGDKLRYIDRFDDNSFLTNVGLCDIGTTCTLGGFKFSAREYSLSDGDIGQAGLTPREARVAARAIKDGNLVEPVAIELGDSYSVAASTDVDVILYGDGVVVNEADLANVAVSVPPHLSITDMTLKNADQKYPALVSKISFRDFATYTEAECYHSELSGPGNAEGVECEFSFSISFDFSDLFSDFFFSLSLHKVEHVDHGWDDQPSFSLFE